MAPKNNSAVHPDTNNTLVAPAFAGNKTGNKKTPVWEPFRRYTAGIISANIQVDYTRHPTFPCFSLSLGFVQQDEHGNPVWERHPAPDAKPGDTVFVCTDETNPGEGFEGTVFDGAEEGFIRVAGKDT